MYNWSTDEKTLQSDPRRHAIWRLEQLINFGLEGEKIDRDLLRTYLPELAIDPKRREFLLLVLNESHDP